MAPGVEAPSAAEGACSPPGSVGSVQANHRASRVSSQLWSTSTISLRMKKQRKIPHINSGV